METPLLSRTTGTDPQLDFFSAKLHSPPDNPRLYLQTSPEFAMKRLLAAGCGSIYQICKAFRNAETGRFHNPEFTMLEWYRVAYDLQQLMDEVAELLKLILFDRYKTLPIKQVTYQQLFFEHTGLDALEFNLSAYQDFAQKIDHAEAISLCADQHPLWLDYYFSHVVQPAMVQAAIYLVHDYPAILSSLARLHQVDSRVTERFEVFINCIELGNAYFELTDVAQQTERFERENAYRLAQGLNPVEIDQRLLAALRSGLPDSSGVALGLDRILMIKTSSCCIDEVLAFPILNA